MPLMKHRYNLRLLAGLGAFLILTGGCASVRDRLAQKIEYIIPKDEVSPGEVFQLGLVLPEEIRGGYLTLLDKKYRIYPRSDLGHRTFSANFVIPSVDPGDYKVTCTFKTTETKTPLVEQLNIQILPDFVQRKVDSVKGRKFNSESYLKDKVKIQERLFKSVFHPKRKQDFVLPLGGEIVSTFGTVRKYGDKAEVALEGIEIKSVSASVVDVNAAADGKVVMAEELSMLGNTVILDHGYGFATLYCHLRNLEVKQGQTVLRGDRLGLVGRSGGAAVDTRLYYQLYVSGAPADVQRYMDINVFE